MLIFKNDNLIRESVLPNENYAHSIELTYTYTNIPNRLRNQEKPLIFPAELYTTFWMSKYLPATRVTNLDNQGEFPPNHFDWVLNEQGYPINDGNHTSVSYTYECEK